MTKSELFKVAHKLARNTVRFVGNYSIALSFALKSTYKSERDNAIYFGETTITKSWVEDDGFGGEFACFSGDFLLI